MAQPRPEDIYDVTIIGGGPTGLFAAYYAGFRTLRTKIIDSMPDLGGQITALYPEKNIFDVAGFPKILGKELVKNLVQQAKQYDPTICLDEKVLVLEDVGEKLIRLGTDKGEHFTKVVIITAGIGMFTPRKYNKPQIDSYEGRGLYYFVKELEPFRGKNILIVGGGDSALDWALNLEPIAANITLIHRRDGFRAHEDSVRQLFRSRAKVKLFYELKELNGDGFVKEAVIFHNKSNQIENLKVDAVVACLGFISNLGPIAEWGLDLEEDSIVVNSKMETNRPGVYAAGDICTYPGKVKLIVTGFGEAATAVNNAAKYINPKASVFPGHSSTLLDKSGEVKVSV